MTEIPTLTKRRLQAQVIGPIYHEMVAAIGEEKASAILDAAIRKAAIAEGKEFAKRAPGGITSMADFIELYELWTADGALEMTVLDTERLTLRELSLEDVEGLLEIFADPLAMWAYPSTKTRAETVTGVPGLANAGVAVT